MRLPGSVEGIPETAKITFKEAWSRTTPGKKTTIAFHDKLAVFPHRNWLPFLNKEYECVLYPLERSAIACPVNGIPNNEVNPETSIIRFNIDKDTKKALIETLVAVVDVVETSVIPLLRELDPQKLND